ncbi:type I-E CRISPR-associated protein Cse2/CasB [Streptomyces xanthophaeus]
MEIARFVADVIALCAQDKRAQADLRSGLGLPYERCHRLHRHLVRLVPAAVRHPAARRPYYAVAALIAARSRSAREEEADRAAEESVVQAGAQGAAGSAEGAAVEAPDPEGRGAAQWGRRQRITLGASLGEAVNRGVMKPDSAESELHYLARVGSDSLHGRLPALLRQFNGRGVVLDWAVLLEDLSWWERRQDHIATRWLEDFFRVRAAEERGLADASAVPASGRSGSSMGRENDQNDDISEENE